MKIYYFGELIGEYKMRSERENETSRPTLVRDVLKARDDYSRLVKINVVMEPSDA